MTMRNTIFILHNSLLYLKLLNYVGSALEFILMYPNQCNSVLKMLKLGAKSIKMHRGALKEPRDWVTWILLQHLGKQGLFLSLIILSVYYKYNQNFKKILTLTLNPVVDICAASFGKVSVSFNRDPLSSRLASLLEMLLMPGYC